MKHLLAFLVTITPVVGQNPTSERREKAALEILDRSIKASFAGKPENAENSIAELLTTIHYSDGEKRTLSIKAYASGNRSRLEVFDTITRDKVLIGSDGKTDWMTINGKEAEMTKSQLEQRKRSVAISNIISLIELQKKPELYSIRKCKQLQIGQEKYDSIEVTTQAIPGKITLLFDSQNFLLYRSSVSVDGKEIESTIYKDYKKTDGRVRSFHITNYANEALHSEEQYLKREYVQSMDDSLFVNPARK